MYGVFCVGVMVHRQGAIWGGVEAYRLLALALEGLRV